MEIKKTIKLFSRRRENHFCYSFYTSSLY